MEVQTVKNSLKVSSYNQLLDANGRVNTINDIYSIDNPAVGQLVYVEEVKEVYAIDEVDDSGVNAFGGKIVVVKDFHKVGGSGGSGNISVNLLYSKNVTIPNGELTPLKEDLLASREDDNFWLTKETYCYYYRVSKPEDSAYWMAVKYNNEWSIIQLREPGFEATEYHEIDGDPLYWIWQDKSELTQSWFEDIWDLLETHTEVKPGAIYFSKNNKTYYTCVGKNQDAPYLYDWMISYSESFNPNNPTYIHRAYCDDTSQDFYSLTPRRVVDGVETNLFYKYTGLLINDEPTLPAYTERGKYTAKDFNWEEFFGNDQIGLQFIFCQTDTAEEAPSADDLKSNNCTFERFENEEWDTCNGIQFFDNPQTLVDKNYQWMYSAKYNGAKQKYDDFLGPFYYNQYLKNTQRVYLTASQYVVRPGDTAPIKITLNRVNIESDELSDVEWTVLLFKDMESFDMYLNGYVLPAGSYEQLYGSNVEGLSPISKLSEFELSFSPTLINEDGVLFVTASTGGWEDSLYIQTAKAGVAYYLTNPFLNFLVDENGVVYNDRDTVQMIDEQGQIVSNLEVSDLNLPSFLTLESSNNGTLVFKQE